ALELELAVGSQLEIAGRGAVARLRIVDRTAFPFDRSASESGDHHQPLEPARPQRGVGVVRVALVGIDTDRRCIDDAAAISGAAAINLDPAILAAGRP